MAAMISAGDTRAFATYRYSWFSSSFFVSQLSKTALVTAERSFWTYNMATGILLEWYVLRRAGKEQTLCIFLNDRLAEVGDLSLLVVVNMVTENHILVEIARVKEGSWEADFLDVCINVVFP
jgi:hypothetical protein